MAKKSMIKSSSREHLNSPPEHTTDARSAAGPMPTCAKYGICRICFRELAYKGQIPGREEGKLVKALA